MSDSVGHIHTVRIRSDTRDPRDTHTARIGRGVSARRNGSGVRQKHTVVAVARVTAGTRQ